MTDVFGAPISTRGRLDYAAQPPEPNAYGPWGMSWAFRPFDFLGSTVRSTIFGAMTNNWTPLWENLKVWDPVTEQEFVSGRRLLKEFGVHDNDGIIDVPVLGEFDIASFAVEVATDPLTYMSAGITKAGTAAASKATTVSSRALMGFDVGRVFSPSAGKFFTGGRSLTHAERAWHLIKEIGPDGADDLLRHMVDEAMRGGADATDDVMRYVLSNEVTGKILPKVDDMWSTVSALRAEADEAADVLVKTAWNDETKDIAVKLALVLQEGEAGATRMKLTGSSFGSFLREASQDYVPPSLRKGAEMLHDLGGGSRAAQVREGLRGVRFGGNVIAPEFQERVGKYVFDKRFMRRLRDGWARMWSKHGQSELMKLADNFRRGIQGKYSDEALAHATGAYKAARNMAKDRGAADPDYFVGLANTLTDVRMNPADLEAIGIDRAAGAVPTAEQVRLLTRKARRDWIISNFDRLNLPDDAAVETVLDISDDLAVRAKEATTKVDEFVGNALGIPVDDVAALDPNVIDQRLIERGYAPVRRSTLNSDLLRTYESYNNELMALDERIAAMLVEKDRVIDEIYQKEFSKRKKAIPASVKERGNVLRTILGEEAANMPNAPANATVNYLGKKQFVGNLTRDQLSEAQRQLNAELAKIADELDDIRLNPDRLGTEAEPLVRRQSELFDEVQTLQEWREWRDELDELRKKALSSDVSSTSATKNVIVGTDVDDFGNWTLDGQWRPERKTMDFVNGVAPESLTAEAKNIDVSAAGINKINQEAGTIAAGHVYSGILMPALSSLGLPEAARKELVGRISTIAPSIGVRGLNRFQVDEIVDETIRFLSSSPETADRVDLFLRQYVRGMTQFEQEMVAQGARKTRPIVREIRMNLDRVVSRQQAIASNVAEAAYNSAVAEARAAARAETASSAKVRGLLDRLATVEDRREFVEEYLDSNFVTKIIAENQSYIPHQMPPELLALFEKMPGGKQFVESMSNPHNLMRRFRTKNGLAMSLREVLDIMGDMKEGILNAPDVSPGNADLFSRLDSLFNRTPRINLEGIDDNIVKAVSRSLVNDPNTPDGIRAIQREIFADSGKWVDADTVQKILTRDNPATFAPYHHKLIASVLEDSPEFIEMMSKHGFQRVADGVVPEGFARITIPGLTDYAAKADFAREFNGHVGANWVYAQFAPNGQQLRMDTWVNNPAEAKELVQKAFREAAEKPGFSYFETNPGAALQMYAANNMKAASSKFRDKTVKALFGKPSKFAPDGYVPVNDPAFDGWHFRPDVAHGINMQYDAIHDPGVVGAYRREFGRVFGWFNKNLKNFMTRLWPSYWTRNFISDGWQSFLGGGLDFESRVFASKIQRAHLKHLDALQNGSTYNEARKILDDALGDLSYRGQRAMDVYSQAQSSGIFYSGEFAAGFGGSLAGDVPRAMKKIKGTTYQKGTAYIGEWGANVANFMEGNHRLGHFAKKLADGESVDAAANSVRQFLFDFGDVGWMDEVIEPYLFFWRWTRKNTSFFTQLALQKPAAITAMQKAILTSERSKDGVSEDKFPRWLAGKAIRVADGFDVNGEVDPRYFVLDGFIPQVEIMAWGNKFDKGLVGGIASIGIDRLMPPIKVPLEFALNRNLFLDTEIQKFQGERKKVGVGLPGVGKLTDTYVSPQAYHASRQIRQLNWLHNVYSAYDKGEPVAPLVYSDLLLGAKERRSKPEVTGFYRRFELQQELSAAKKAMNEAERGGDMEQLEEFARIAATIKARMDALPTEYPER